MTVDEFVDFVIDFWVDSGWTREELDESWQSRRI